jgi:DNA-binding LacI/PurR family transcriptional regulator
MKKTGDITLATLADRLNVTTTTVSKALRGKPGIGLEMVKKVQDLARELNYQPNFAAQSLKKSSSDSIGLLITSDITNPWYAQLVSSIESELSKRGKTMILSLGKNDYEKERNCLEAFRGGRVAGVIVGPIFHKRNLENIWQSLNHGLPMVLFNCMEEMPVNYVALNMAAGAKLAVDYFVEMGHRRIGYLCSSEGDLQEMGKTRREGFEQAMFEHGFPLIGTDIIMGGITRKSGYEAMKTLLSQPGRKLPTALFCHNDSVAYGAMTAIHRAGLSVPEDFSLIGFDDLEESCSTEPPLTTIGGVKEELANELVDAILDMAKTKTVKRIKKEIFPKLIIRETVIKLTQGVKKWDPQSQE